MSPNDEINGISVVTTTWNEKDNIEELVQRINQTLQGTLHEVIVVDDSSIDGTLELAELFADVAIGKVREGQTKGLLVGAKLAKFPVIVTIDSDLENNPEYIPAVLEKLDVYDVVVASRTVVPRFSEKLASRTLGRMVGVSDFFSNFRAYKKSAISEKLLGGETFGGELLVTAKKKGFKIGETKYVAPKRRIKPRIGGSVKANLRIIIATWKCWIIYLFS